MRRLLEPVIWQGVGIHSGATSQVTCRPGPVGGGCWISSGQGEAFPVSPAAVSDVRRCTVLQGPGGQSVATVEHLFSALAALGIYDLHIQVDGPEIPILDGSALPFFEALREHSEPAAGPLPWVLQRPLWVGQGESMVLALPGQHTRYGWALHYDHPMLGYQECTFEPEVDDYASQIGLARTFALQEEVELLRSQGLAQGGSLDNALVVQPQGFSSPLRISQEPVRHKCLDLIGDLYLVGRPVRARFWAVKAGHRWHVEMARKLVEEVMGSAG